MENSPLASIAAGIKALQSLVGNEHAKINQVTYPCIVGMEHNELDPVYGGEKSISHVGISIRIQDISTAPVVPAIGNPAQLIERNRTYRVNGLTYTQTTWELDLVDISN